MMKVLDLFSGIGGFALGMEATGKFKTAAFCEWDSQCQQVLRKHWPSVPIHGDVTDLTCAEGSFDVITGGFPCQDISYAGKGAGLTGSRSGYWFEYLRLIQEVKPKGVIIENVSALRSRGLGTVLQNLNAVGYDAEWHCISAANLGASHTRERIWIIAYRNGTGGKGFVPLGSLGTNRQGGWRGKEDLQYVFDNPFGRRDSMPQPLLRGMDVRLSRRVDRLKQIGNSVYWPIVELLGNHLYSNIKDM